MSTFTVTATDGTTATLDVPGPNVTPQDSVHRLDGFNPGTLTQATMADLVSRLGHYPKADRLFCGPGERPSEHLAFVRDVLHPHGVVPLISTKTLPSEQVIADIRAMPGPGVLIYHHEPFPDSGPPVNPTAQGYVDLNFRMVRTDIPAINEGRAPEDQWRSGLAFHGFPFKYEPATATLPERVTYAKKFRDLGGPAAWLPTELLDAVDLPGCDCYDSGQAAVNPDGGIQGPAQRMLAWVKFLDLQGLSHKRVIFPEFGSYADGNFEEACAWLNANRDRVAAACSWDHAEISMKLEGRKLAAFKPLLTEA